MSFHDITRLTAHRNVGRMKSPCEIQKNINFDKALSGVISGGPCHHDMARPQVADGGTASNMEGNCEYI